MRHNKSIYDLKLHESMTVKCRGEGYPTEFQVTRVHGGYFYQDLNPRITVPVTFFTAE